MISVIIPYYNSEGWICRCADSLHRQDGDFEFIFVNDNSTDKGPALLKDYEDRRFILLDNQRGRGVSGARNTGLDAAGGEWVTFLDADDEMVPDAYIVYCRMMRLDKTVNIIQANHLRHYEKSGKTALKYFNRKGIYSLDHLPQMWCMVWNKLYRRSIIGDTRFIEGLQFGEDEIFNLDIFAKDERIWHTQTNTVTVLRNFDNKGSLSRVKKREDILAQARALEDYLMRTDNKRAKMAAMQRIAWHWESQTYINAFGGEWR